MKLYRLLSLVLLMGISGLRAETEINFEELERAASRVNRSEIAFAGAEGFGAYAQGGRGGKVLRVTTLEDTGNVGSLRWAVEQPYPRIVEFGVSGVIELNEDLRVESPLITIDGSTAPGDGITLKDGTLKIIGVHDVIVRHIRVRPGDEVALKKGKWKKQKREGKAPQDAITVTSSAYVMIDHCSASWCSDEVLSVSDSKNVTVQWCFITEPLANPKLHIEEGAEISHAYGGLANGDNISYIKNLFAYFKIRGPQMGTAKDIYLNRVASVNNYICYYLSSGTRLKPREDKQTQFELINNLYAYPLASKAIAIEVPSEGGDVAATIRNTRMYLKGNSGPGLSENNPLQGVATDFGQDVLARMYSDWQLYEIPQLQLFSAQKVEKRILANAGATSPRRDAIDERIVKQVSNGQGALINSQDDMGGYVGLAR